MSDMVLFEGLATAQSATASLYALSLSACRGGPCQMRDSNGAAEAGHLFNFIFSAPQPPPFSENRSLCNDKTSAAI